MLDKYSTTARVQRAAHKRQLGERRGREANPIPRDAGCPSLRHGDTSWKSSAVPVPKAAQPHQTMRQGHSPLWSPARVSLGSSRWGCHQELQPLLCSPIQGLSEGLSPGTWQDLRFIQTSKGFWGKTPSSMAHCRGISPGPAVGTGRM